VDTSSPFELVIQLPDLSGSHDGEGAEDLRSYSGCAGHGEVIPRRVWLSAEQLIVPVPGVVVAVTVRPETVALAVLVEVQAGEMQSLGGPEVRVAVQVST
jgi:hypothetical protein